MPFFEALATLLWVLVCVIVVLGLAYWFTRHVAGRMGPGLPAGAKGGEKLRVLAQLALGKDQKLVLVQVGERYLLLGAAAAGISNLAELTPEEAEAWRAAADGPEAGQPPSFREALQKVLKQKIQR